MASPDKRCPYDILRLHLDCTPDEIRSAYRKLALQRHPDKLIKSGISEAEATASFQELVNAYEVLSDPRERAWYDSHRSQILFASSNSNSKSFAGVLDLFTFFSNSVFSGYSDTGKGFYKVYADVFDKVYQNELNYAKKLGLGAVVPEAPVMGNLKSYYAQVNAFYGYWLGFATVVDFVWVDMYDSMAGVDRKSRRVMEEENKKLRKKAKREYNETVRNLAEFVKKRDKRVIDMQLKKNEEMEKKREEERERKRKLEREKAEKAMAYVEPEWARVEEEEEVEEVVGDDEKKNEWYCVACSKKFKSDKQWKNHEQSKKHKEKVAELREAFRAEDGQHKEEEDDQEEEVLLSDEGKNGFVAEENGVDELKEQFEDCLEVQEEEDDDYTESQSIEEEAAININNGLDLKGITEELGLEEDKYETSFLEEMLVGRKNKKAMRKPRAPPKNVHEVECEEIDLMEYNNRKGSRRNRGGRKEKDTVAQEDEENVEVTETSSEAKEDGDSDKTKMEESSLSNPREENKNDSKENTDQSTKVMGKENVNDSKRDADKLRRVKGSKQSVDTKAINKKDMTSKSKNAPKGRKQKATSRSSGHECDTCGENFESRNKLHKHLNDTGHASLKSR